MTARQVVMMTPADKRAIEGRAKKHGLSPSEWIRRAAKSFQPVDAADDAMMNALADEIEAAARDIRVSLNRAEKEMEFHRAEMARIKAGGLAS